MKCPHFSWLRHDATGTIMLVLATVVRTAMRESGCMGNDQELSRRPLLLASSMNKRTRLVRLRIVARSPPPPPRYDTL
ncbi:hypothetical protein F4808DRAFT_406313, partial [Astrocystis sublimbata]